MILLVTGARALDDDEESRRWAQHIIGVAIGRTEWGTGKTDPIPAIKLVLTGGCQVGPDAWAERIAHDYEIPWTSYALDGYRYSASGQGERWRVEPGPCTNPHERNRFMVAGLRAMADRGKKVNVVALLAGWSKTNGARRTAEWARRAGLGVSWHELLRPGLDIRTDEEKRP